ncbi:MAG: VCBS repeat-containing protein [Planctomycetaceae bacterium]|nr:VCBS repeat-containing protein [Planctomycetaceae bacterium]
MVARRFRTRVPALGLLLTMLAVSNGCRQEAGPAKPVATGTEGESTTETSVKATPESVREWLTMHNRGVAHLENKEWADAETQLSKLAEALSTNLPAARNLAVSRVFSLVDRATPFDRSKAPEKVQAAIERANDAVKKFASLATDNQDKAVAALLAGKLAAFEDSSEKPRMDEAIKSFREAASLSGDKPEMLYAFAVAMEGHREYSESAELIELFQKIFELAPDNLMVLNKLLEKQAMGLTSDDAKTKAVAANLSKTLERAAVLLEPLRASILKQRRQDIVELIQKGLAKATPENPSPLISPAMLTKNLVLPELSTQVDQRRIDLNLLEYLTVDLVPSLNLPDDVRTAVFGKTEPTVLQKFTVADAAALPALESVSNVHVADINLDGRDDLVALVSGRVVVHQRTAEGGWSSLCESAEGGPVSNRFLLADLDRDFDRQTLGDIKVPLVVADRNGDRKVLPELAGKQRWFDADPDVVAWSRDSVNVFLNELNGDQRTLTPIEMPGNITGINDVTVADLEADGDLDLIVATDSGITLLRSLNGKTFEPITEGVASPAHAIKAVFAVDWNRDMAMDVVGVSPEGDSGWMQNMLHSRFRWIAGAKTGTPAEDLIVDHLNMDGPWDALTTGTGGTSVWLPPNGDRMEDIKATSVSTAPGSQLLRADFDNDGHSDVLVIHATKATLLRGAANGTFEDLTTLLPEETGCVAAEAADLDEDGDLDLILVAESGAISLLTNNGGNANEWTDVVTRAIGDDPQFPSNRVNMYGIGAIIEARTGEQWQSHPVEGPRTHLGLGKAKQMDSVRVIWTDGIPQNLTGVQFLKSRLGVLAPQILIGSCPYIYTWNGKEFQFFSDCLWAAPIGLVQANGDFAPTREWENLLIPGEMLQPKDGRYVIQLTEELWEAAYFDEVKLVAVDHPADVEVFSNEKVGSPQMAAHRIHTVKNRQLPDSVVDGHGNDLLPGLKAVDQDYVQAFRGRRMQGLTDEWTMEFHLQSILAQNSPVKNIRLVLIGWVFPTDTSLNQAILQNPDLDPPSPPSLEVLQADGQWKTAMPFLGFPSGKTKAMVIDLAEVLPLASDRIRIRSSMELYWDAAFFIVNEDDAETKPMDCRLVGADLHYRGFSQRTYADTSVFRNGRAPEGYDYSNVITEPRWSEMAGRFTRYGSVQELLLSQDDQMIVMGPGDEATVEFQVPETPVPEGWKRDFILYNVGWDKDANLATVYGQSSEPYPFKEMGQYPGTPDQMGPTTPEYLNYLKTYQTREYPRFQFRDAVRLQVQ